MCSFLRTIIFYLLPICQGGYYLPTIVWDPTNPILKKEHWFEVVNVGTFDTLSFICPSQMINMVRVDTKTSYLNHNLYVKEFSPGTKSFDDACDTRGAKLLKRCNKPRDFQVTTIQINTQQAHVSLPTFQPGKDYIFFATSNGTRKSLNTTSKACTMVFRVHFCTKNETCPYASCFLFGRKRVCEEKLKPAEKPDCTSAMPRGVNITKITSTSIDIEWQEPNKTGCNITSYSIRKNPEDLKQIQVTSSIRSVSLEHLVPSTEYRISVRAYTSTGTGRYSKEVVGITNEMSAIASQQTGSTEVSVDPASLGIGVAVGSVVSLCLAVVLWFYLTRRQRCKVDKKKLDSSASFDQKNDCEKETVALNTGYRESVIGQGWPLPKINEEDHSSFSSEA